MQQPLAGQQPQRDTTTTDTVVVDVPLTPAESLLVDTTAQAEPPIAVEDTLKAPIARWVAPPTYVIGPAYRWNRDELFASGALTLLELLERLPGVTGLRSGWITSAHVAAYLGDPGRVRIYYDGLEIESLSPRTGGVNDLTNIPLWSLEEVVVVRGATELRVYLSSWSYRRTEPNTRTDVFTGDEETNLYRGFYGKRFARGELLQLGAQQYGSNRERQTGVSGDELSVLLRGGWSRRLLSVDAYATRTRRTRQTQFTLTRDDSIPALEETHTIAYLRAGYGDPLAGPWAQLMASHQRVKESPGGSATGPEPDSSRSQSEYVAAAGFARGGARLTAIGRTTVGAGEVRFGQSLEAAWESALLGVTAFAEREGVDSTSRLDLSLRFTPVRFLSLIGAVGQVRDDRTQSTGEDALFARAEAGLRLGETWIGGGVMYRDSVLTTPPEIYDPDLGPTVSDEAVGAFALVRGRVWKGIHIDLTATRWDQPGLYRPQYLTRAQLYLSSRWLRRFPSGDFGILASVTHEYRSAMPFSIENGAFTAAPQSRVLSTLLEIRIVSAVLSWQVRNFLGAQYQIIPGYEMPRITNLYGVRWNFFN